MVSRSNGTPVVGSAVVGSPVVGSAVVGLPVVGSAVPMPVPVWVAVAVSLAMSLPVAVARADRPVPIGQSTTTISYRTAAGQVSFTGSRPYLANAIGPSDATVLDAASNISTFNSFNSFGRRTFLASNDTFSDVLGPDESLITTAFFKVDNNGDYFPGIVEGGDVTVTVENVHFSQPVNVDERTFLMHVLWLPDQADPLGYINVHNHHTHTDPFRDFDEFLDGGVFSDFPFPGANYELGGVSPVFTGNGTDTLSFTITFPYDLLKNLEESDPPQPVPPGLPAPQGFLEPFHFHFEYVVPEPATMVLLLGAMICAGRGSNR